MDRKGLSNQQRERLISNMEGQISQLKHITKTINQTLEKQKETRDSLGDYLEKGTQGLKKINKTLAEMGSRYSVFGCNGAIVVGIAFLTLLLLILL